MVWKGLAAGAGLAAAAAARNVVVSAWRQVRDSDPPANPESPDTGWSEALAWAILTGALVEVARLVGRRTAAAGWRRATGDLPPGLEQTA